MCKDSNVMKKHSGRWIWSLDAGGADGGVEFLVSWSGYEELEEDVVEEGLHEAGWLNVERYTKKRWCCFITSVLLRWNKVQICSNKPKDSHTDGTAASCGAADVLLRCRLYMTGPPTYKISTMHPCESSTLRLWASSLCAFHVFVTWMKTCWSRWQFGRLTEVEEVAGEGGEGGESWDVAAASEPDLRRETAALLQMTKVRLVQAYSLF